MENEACANCARVGYYSNATHMGNDGYGNQEPLCESCRGYADEPEEPETTVHYAEGFTFVNVYEVDRIYGGPEEGGWYYDAGRLITSRQVPEADAERVRAELEEKYSEGTGRNASWSVLYAGGDYQVWIEDKPGADYPEHTPYYE